MKTKRCSKCRKRKKISLFGKRSQAKDGLSSYCKKCHNKRAIAEYYKNPQYMKKYNKEYRENHKRDLENKRLLRDYGIDLDELQDRLRCAVCGRTFEVKSLKGKSKHGRPHVDHDHVLNIVRGILCSNCNTAIGLLKENPEIVRAVLKYLEKTNANFDNR